MTREELIAHLEHLAEYVKYSEDAPALREVIEMLKCSEMPNSSKDFFWKNARKNARKYTETHARDLIERETARRIIDSPRSKEQMLRMLEATPPAQPDHIAEVGKKVDADLISRHDVYTFLDEMRYPLLANLIMNEECIPSAQPDNRLSKIAELVEGTIDHFDLDDAMDLLYQIKDVLEDGCSDVQAIMDLPSAQPERRWIPCSDRMPDQYGNYLISIEGDEPDIGTINPKDPRGWSLCDATGFYWASDKALNITAWMPLPGPYKEESNG